MSGGHFNYNQHKISDIADTIEEIINTNDSQEKDDFGYEIGRHYKKETIDEFKNGLAILRMASIYAHRIDWLLSGDDGEDNFLKRLKEELENKSKN